MFHRVATISDIRESEVIERVVAGKAIALYNVGGVFFATDALCTHGYAHLAEGYVEGGVIECPMPGGRFEIRTGRAAGPPCTEDLVTYEVKLEADTILIGLPVAATTSAR
jgi:naphthalene 1,2-dioxygenase ferredoxin component